MSHDRTPDVHGLLVLAVDLVRRAGELVRDGREGAASQVGAKSSPTDVVTAMDRASEALVVEGLRAARPADGVLGEEGGERGGTGGVRWLLDPIDGTVNYLYGIPLYAVSLAAEVDGVVQVGVVRNPVTGEEWTAVRGEGAWRDGCRLAGSAVAELASALVGTGFGYRAEQRAEQATVAAALLPRVRDIRRLGAASLDLCYAADGRLDAYYEQGLHPWDLAAGGLIAEEAGLRVTGLGGRPAGAEMTLAAPPALHPVLHAELTALIPR
ncbi:MAG TPA: inositol monophosphatase family protein [Cryptosporangiaceae bacterium]|nr:inositol monophosphatase family protein [Cryptosporangiaceae bacterium]